MIKAVIVVNTSGKQRLIRFYEELPWERRNKIIAAVYQECIKRGDTSCNFIEQLGIWEDFKIVYRLYATLYIVFIVDSGENELAILDLIQVFVEVLDKAFENVCELDLTFHAEKAYAILEEVIVGGMPVETNINEIWKIAELLIKHEKQH